MPKPEQEPQMPKPEQEPQMPKPEQEPQMPKPEESEIEEIEVDADEQTVYIHTSTGMIKINGEDLSMWVECERYAS
jgi:hypothetical protein